MDTRHGRDDTTSGHQPRPPAVAYTAYEHALAAFRHRHRSCPTRTDQLPLRFLSDRDNREIVVWTTRPSCLIQEMRLRGCTFQGVSVLGEWVARQRCPATPDLMPWS